MSTPRLRPPGELTWADSPTPRPQPDSARFLAVVTSFLEAGLILAQGWLGAIGLVAILLLIFP